MNDATYLWLNDEQAGPFTALQLRSMWTAGTITAATLCWQEGMEEWVPVGGSIEEAIAAEKRAEAANVKRNQIASERRLIKAAEDSKKEKPLGTREAFFLMAFALLMSPIAFLVSIYYAIRGRHRRAVWTFSWSMLFGAVFYFFKIFG